MKKIISTNNAPAAIVPYSQAIEVNGMVFLSGQLPIDPATGDFPEGGARNKPNNVSKTLNRSLPKQVLQPTIL